MTGNFPACGVCSWLAVGSRFPVAVAGGSFSRHGWRGVASRFPWCVFPWLPVLHGSRALSMVAVLRALPVALPADMVGVTLSPGVAPGWYVLPVAYSPRCGGCLLSRLTGRALSLSRRVLPAPALPALMAHLVACALSRSRL